jgi:hypothetical protein
MISITSIRPTENPLQWTVIFLQDDGSETNDIVDGQDFYEAMIAAEKNLVDLNAS